MYHNSGPIKYGTDRKGKICHKIVQILNHRSLSAYVYKKLHKQTITE